MIITLHATPHIHLPASCPLFFFFIAHLELPVCVWRGAVSWNVGNLLVVTPASSYHLPTGPTLGKVCQELFPHVGWDFGWFNCVSLPS